AMAETKPKNTEATDKAEDKPKAKAKAKTETKSKAEPKAKAKEKEESEETTEIQAEPQAEVKTPEVEQKETVSQEDFLKDFNWHNYEEGIEQVEDAKLKEFETLVEENFVDTADEEVVEGTVIHLTDREAIIDINAKSEGVISLNEFRYNPDLKVGDKVEVLIDVREDKTGQLVLS